MLKLKQHGPDHVSFSCPGCKETHVIGINPELDRPNWELRGGLENPSLRPSILYTSGHYAPHYQAGHGCWCSDEAKKEEWGFSCVRCHCFVTNGQVQFLNDCSHEFAGQTLDMEEVVDRPFS